MPSATSTPGGAIARDRHLRAQPPGDIVVGGPQASASATPSTTPPTSDLCATPGAAVFSTTGQPTPRRRRRPRRRLAPPAPAIDRHAVVGEQREPLELAELAAGREPGPPARRGPRPRTGAGGSAAGRARASRWASSARSASSPTTVPSSTGMPSVAQERRFLERDRARQVRQHAERLRRSRPDVLRDLQVALVVGLALPGHVDDERQAAVSGSSCSARNDSRKIRSASMPVPQASSGFAASSPGSSASSMRGERLVGDPRERHAQVVREVDEQRALAAGVVDARDAAPGARRAARRREQLHRVGHLVERAHLVHAVRVEQRLVRAVLAGQRAGVRRHHRLRTLGAPDLQRDHGHVVRRRRVELRSGSPSGSRTVSSSSAITRVSSRPSAYACSRPSS